MKQVVFDIETDGLIATKIHCLVMCEVGTSNFVKITSYDKMKKIFLREDIRFIGHNIIRYDIPTIERLLDIKVKENFVDTLVLSWTMYPRRPIHGLESWGEEFGVPKPQIDDWENLSIEDYLHRCTEDVKINMTLWNKISKRLDKLYNNQQQADKYINYLSFKMKCAMLQERSKWKLDVDKVNEGKAELQVILQNKYDLLEAAMPDVPKYSSMSYPKKPYKVNGDLSAVGEKWFALLKEQGLPENHTDDVKFVSGQTPPNAGSSVQVKNWLFSLGWEPVNFDFKRNKETGEVRKIPQVKSTEDDGSICDSVKALFKKEPKLENLDSIGVIRHRIGILDGYLRDLDDDGCVRAAVQGLTNTLRFKHSVCLNLPGVDKPYGELVRGALMARKGNLLCGSDMSGLEDRLKQHYIFPYDPDYVNEMNVEDYDPHLALALSDGAITQADIDAYRAKTDGGRVKPIRHNYKQGNYACQYLAGPPRLALTINIPLKDATAIYNAYWKKNWAIKEVSKEQVTKKVDGEMWLLNPINGFWYWLKNTKDIFSTLVQGSASYAFDVWIGFILNQREQLTGQFHDEFISEVLEEEENMMTKITRKAMCQTNKFLKLNRELDCDIQFGYRYSEIH